MSDEEVDPSDFERPATTLTVGAYWQECIDNAVLTERARCRAIVLRLFGNDWKGNQALAEIDGGKVG